MDENRKLLDHYVERYNAGDLDACIDLYAEDAVQLMPDGLFEGPGEIRERLARDLVAFPDATYTVTSFVEHGGAFADEWTFTGTQDGPFVLPDGGQLPPTGRRVEVKGMELVRVRDGKIVVDNLYYDTMAAVVQLGLGPQRDVFEVTARVKIRDGELDGFKAQAAEMLRLTREKDTKTIRYDWFLNEDGTACEVREGYVDADGLLEHAQNVNEAREKLFQDYAYGHEMTIFGEPSPALAALIDRLAGHVTFNRYSLLQGLASDSRALDGVPA